MLKNNKGYFLTEIIIALAIVAIAITVLYVNSMSTYIKQDNELSKFNTTDGIYSAGEIKDYFLNIEDNFQTNIETTGYLDVMNYIKDTGYNKDFFNSLDIKNIYFTNYNMKLFIDKMDLAASIKSNLKTMKYDENLCEYRYILIFNDDSYSTVGVDCYE